MRVVEMMKSLSGALAAATQPLAGSRSQKEPVFLVDLLWVVLAFAVGLKLMDGYGVNIVLYLWHQSPASLLALVLPDLSSILLLSGPGIVLAHWLHRRKPRCVAWGELDWLVAGFGFWIMLIADEFLPTALLPHAALCAMGLVIVIWLLLRFGCGRSIITRQRVQSGPVKRAAEVIWSWLVCTPNRPIWTAVIGAWGSRIALLLWIHRLIQLIADWPYRRIST
jgi:hypothetical protein